MPHDTTTSEKPALAERRNWYVYITPKDGVGGEFPKPIPFRSKRAATNYAAACIEIGQSVRLTRRAAK